MLTGFKLGVSGLQYLGSCSRGYNDLGFSG